MRSRDSSRRGGQRSRGRKEGDEYAGQGRCASEANGAGPAARRKADAHGSLRFRTPQARRPEQDMAVIAAIGAQQIGADGAGEARTSTTERDERAGLSVVGPDPTDLGQNGRPT